MENQQLCVNGHYIKWLKNHEPDKINKDMAEYISFPKRNLFHPSLPSSKIGNRYNDMIYIEGNESINQYTTRRNKSHRNDFGKQKKLLQHPKMRENKDTSSENSHKNYRTNNLSQPRYANMSQNMSAEEHKSKHKTRYNSEYEPEDYAEMVQVRDLNSKVRKVFTREKPSIGI